MTKAFEQLARILKLEVEQGYKNKAVVGGIRQFAAIWVGAAREEAVDDADSFFVNQVAEILTGYGKLSGIEARADTLDNLFGKMKTRSERIAKMPKKVVAKPAAPAPAKRQAAQQKKAAPVAQAQPKPNQPDAQAKPKPSKKKSQKERPAPDPAGLLQPTTALKGVGTKNAELLAKLGADTIGDLLRVLPRRYDDYTAMKPINRLEYGEIVTIIGTVWTIRTRRTRGNKVSVHAVIGDGSGKIQATWFNQPWLADQIKAGTQIVISGKVDQYLGRLVFNSPEWEALSEEQLRTNRIVPVYPLTKGLGSNRMRNVMKDTVDYWGARVPDPLPNDIRARRRLMLLSDALQQVHFPSSQKRLQLGLQRLMFDEVFLLQLGMLHQRRNWQKHPAQPLEAHEGERIRFFNSLPFEPTNAQKRVTAEISADMQRDEPMNRLLQGDVGAGKTLVAAAAILTAVKSGTQAAIMAPTEILAEQHYKGLSQLLTPFDVTVRLLTGGTSTADKKTIKAEIKSGDAQLVIGTTAIIQASVVFKNLGMVVIDEQHRFGVDQRGALREKGKGDFSPHLLVMTATPIPRSLALSLYGDLDLSVLDEMPPGRQEILTRWLKQSERERAYRFISSQIEEGRQVFIIYPLVEESEVLDVPSAVEEHVRLQKEVFPDAEIGLLHGRMKSAEKERVMREFYEGKTQILVSTTVIEVGIDVPNASVIVIEGANRFGLAQLHQLRGRVGRGQHKSYCILISDSTSIQATERLTALEETNDGFQLAEKDLELRGPGEFFGRKQSGLPELQLASMFDVELLSMAREEATQLVANDPDLKKPANKGLNEQVALFWQNAGDVS